MAGNWINYILFMVLILIAILFYHNYILILVLAAIIILAVFSILLFRGMSEKISFSIGNIPERAGRNADIGFEILADNPTFYPMGGIVLKISVENLFYKNNKEYLLNVTNRPFRTTRTAWSFNSLYSGCVRIRIESVIYYDLLRLVRRRKDIGKEVIVEIYPEEKELDMEIQALSEGNGEDEEVQYKKGTDVSEISGIRQYEPGDSLQSIHWKMTARFDDWMVKEYSMPYTNKLCLVLELFRNSDIPDEMDNVLECYLSFARYIMRGGRQFFMIWHNHKTNSNNIREVQTEDDIMLALKDILYAVPSDTRTSAYDMYAAEYGNRTFTCFYVTNASTEGIVNGEKIVTYNGKAVVLNI